MDLAMNNDVYASTSAGPMIDVAAPEGGKPSPWLTSEEDRLLLELFLSEHSLSHDTITQAAEWVAVQWQRHVADGKCQARTAGSLRSRIRKIATSASHPQRLEAARIRTQFRRCDGSAASAPAHAREQGTSASSTSAGGRESHEGASRSTASPPPLACHLASPTVDGPSTGIFDPLSAGERLGSAEASALTPTLAPNESSEAWSKPSMGSEQAQELLGRLEAVEKENQKLRESSEVAWDTMERQRRADQGRHINAEALARTPLQPLSSLLHTVVELQTQVSDIRKRLERMEHERSLLTRERRERSRSPTGSVHFVHRERHMEDRGRASSSEEGKRGRMNSSEGVMGADRLGSRGRNPAWGEEWRKRTIA